MQYEVHTDRLEQTVTSMEEQLADIDHIRQQIIGGFDALGGMWEGSAHDAFHDYRRYGVCQSRI